MVWSAALASAAEKAPPEVVVPVDAAAGRLATAGLGRTATGAGNWLWIWEMRACTAARLIARPSRAGRRPARR
jgi:hypothetical protein